MVWDRTWKATLLLAGTAALLGALWAWGPSATPGDEGGVEVGLSVVGPEDADVFRGTVAPRNATVLGALDAGAEAGGLTYETETYGMGVQVVSINGTRNEGSSGWVYRVLRDGTWCWGDRSSDRYEVLDGDRVRWEWAQEPPAGGCREDEGGG